MAYKPAYLELNPHAINPKKISEGLDFGGVCPWVQKYKGDIHYSGRSGTSSLIKTASAPAGSSTFSGDYILMPKTSTYALGVHALQKACIKENNPHQLKVIIGRKELYRSNSFLENCLARIIDFNTLTNPDGTPRTMKDRLRYFNTWLDSCCGIAYQAKTTKLKLDSQCPQLIGIDTDFAEPFLPIDYASFQGTELDRSSPNFVRDGWMALLEGKTDVYNEYLSVLKAAKGTDVIPNFWKLQNTAEDQLRAVYVYYLDDYFNAVGSLNLDSSGHFLRRSP